MKLHSATHTKTRHKVAHTMLRRLTRETISRACRTPRPPPNAARVAPHRTYTDLRAANAKGEHELVISAYESGAVPATEANVSEYLKVRPVQLAIRVRARERTTVSKYGD